MTRILLAAGIVAGVLVGSGSGRAQSPPWRLPKAPLPVPEAPQPPPPPAAIAPPEPARLPFKRQAAIDRRIEVLRAKLALSAAQAALWTPLANAIRQAALDTAVLADQRADAADTMTAIDNVRDYTRLVHIYAEDMERLTTAFDRLYMRLSPAQRRTADAIFREPSPEEAPPAPHH